MAQYHMFLHSIESQVAARKRVILRGVGVLPSPRAAATSGPPLLATCNLTPPSIRGVASALGGRLPAMMMGPLSGARLAEAAARGALR